MGVPDEPNIGPVEAIAIVGAALRFPGASDPSSFHELTAGGQRMFRQLARPLSKDIPLVRSARDGRLVRRRALRAALLDEEADLRDDEVAHGITTRHLLAAETVAAALADVPSMGRAVPPERIGVFIADIPEAGTADVRDWVCRLLGLGEGDAAAMVTAASPDVRGGVSGYPEPGRACARDLAITEIGVIRRDHAIPTANEVAVVNGPTSDGLHCSLRAITEACEALNSGKFDLVLAGGVAKGLKTWMGGHAAPTLAAKHIRVYDASPTGTLPGEGCGIVALLRAADARAAEVPAYAEIAGWHAAEPSAPQGTVLPAAYRRAGINPSDIQLVEGHGAATVSDDLAELTTLLEVLSPRAGAPSQRCALGSVSANIGDTRSAAGVAALLKTAFAMTADVIPPSTGCVRPNRMLRGDAVPFRFPAAPEPWPQTPVQLAAVNTLGAAQCPDDPRSGPVHVILRRERDAAHRPGRRRKPVLTGAQPARAEEITYRATLKP